MQEAPNKPGGQASTNPLRKRRKMHLWGKPEKYLAKHFNRMQTSWKERQTREKSLCLMLLPQTSLPFICTVFFIAKIAHHLLYCRRFWSPFHQAIFCTKVPWFESAIIPTFFGRQILHPRACMAWGRASNEWNVQKRVETSASEKRLKFDAATGRCPNVSCRCLSHFPWKIPRISHNEFRHNDNELERTFSSVNRS